MLANITVDKKAVRNKSFLYRVPKKMSPRTGSLVLVPFHGQRVVGVVNSVLKDEDKQIRPFRIKEIESIIYPQSLLDEAQLKLAQFISKKYFAPISSVIFAMLPHYLRGIRSSKKILEIIKKNASISQKEKIHPKTQRNYLLFDPKNKYSLKVYQKAIKLTLSRGESALFLVPDLSLEIIKEIKKLSSKSIILNKDKNTDKENFIQWQKVKEGKVNLIIGSHMALFAPLPNLGLIIVHHENDPFYKNDQLPKYHLREVALEFGRLSQASIILQSQTPSLESILSVKKGILKLIPYKSFNIKLGLRKRNNHIKIVDLKNERGLLSLLVIDTIEKNLKKEKRTLLFLNRRGFSRFLICQDCGYSRHLNSNELLPTICPDCSGTNLKEHSFGTRRLEFEMKKLFRQARVIRLDKENLEIEKSSLKSRILNADIVIATSYIFKIEETLFDSIIVILAEIGLSLPDFRSKEELFSTLFWALKMGREKIIQTYYPEHKVIKHLLEDNFGNFADEELRLRKENNYPPFTTLIRLTFDDKNEKKVKQEGKKLAKMLNQLNNTFGSPNEILGPAKVFIQPKNKFKIEIILKGKNPYSLLSLVPENWKVDVDPIELLK
ncbi:MAG: hypothetical protein NT039_00865 [Candidatus Berkelbacteria bacterium]|nr:hypothetical protein [Candidatus Berkelbacteria bacterium]